MSLELADQAYHRLDFMPESSGSEWEQLNTSSPSGSSDDEDTNSISDGVEASRVSTPEDHHHNNWQTDSDGDPTPSSLSTSEYTEGVDTMLVESSEDWDDDEPQYSMPSPQNMSITRLRELGHRLPNITEDSLRNAAFSELMTKEIKTGHAIEADSLDPAYIEKIRSICYRTDTIPSLQHIGPGLRSALQSIRSFDMVEPVTVPREEAILIARGLVISIWLTVCHKILNGRAPVDWFLPSRMSAYFLAAAQQLQPDLASYWNLLEKVVESWLIHLDQSKCFEDQWYNDIPQGDLLALDTSPITNGYNDAVKGKGLLGLVDRFIEEEMTAEIRTPLREQCKSKQNKVEMVWGLQNILETTNPDLLQALLGGCLSYQAGKADSPVAIALQRLKAKVTKQGRPEQPSIYLNALSDRQGFSPTPYQWRRVCKVMSSYISRGQRENSLARRIDRVICPSASWPESLAQRGLRRYGDYESYGSRGRRTACRRTRATIRAFINAMMKRIQDEQDAGGIHTPFPNAVVEVGYSLHPTTRLKQHKEHKSSNYIMNLADAAFKYLYGDCFGIRQYIIYGCYAIDQPWLAEILFTRITQSYTTHGRGFCHSAAGRSNISAYKELPMIWWTEFFYEADQEFQVTKGPAIAMNQLTAQLEAVTMACQRSEQHIELLKYFNDLVEVWTKIFGLQTRIMTDKLVSMDYQEDISD